MFEEIPNGSWWIAGANLTRWFHWPAVSAVLSFAALLKTIEIASRGERDRRSREVNLVKAMLYCTGSAGGCIRDDIEHVKKSKDVPKIIAAVKAASMLPQLAWALEQLKVQEAPATAAIDTYVSAWHSMKCYPGELDHVAQETPEKAVAFLQSRRDAMNGYSKSLASLIVHLGGRPSAKDDAFVKLWIEAAETESLKGRVNRLVRFFAIR